MQCREHLGSYLPVCVPLLLGDIYVIRGTENIASLWKESAHSTSTELHGFFFGLIFKMPKKATPLYAKDNSGFSAKPHPDSHVKPNNRIDYITHQVLKEFLRGPASVELAPRFAARMDTQLSAMTIGDSWVEYTDLLEFFELEMLRANLEVTYGSTLLQIHPNFCRDFWYFSHHLYGFYSPIAKWTSPGAHAARDRLLGALKHWQRLMLQAQEAEGYDQLSHSDAYWGPKEVQKWHARFLQMDGFDEDAVASLYLGIIWV